MLTVSRTPNTSRPSIFDMAGRAKWNAWDERGRSLASLSASEVEAKYLNLCKSLGWVAPDENVLNSAKPATSGPVRPSDEEEVDVYDIDWDAPIVKGGGGGRNTMGNAVSTLQGNEGEEFDTTTLHGLATLGDVERLMTLLELDKQQDVNGKDEFVSRIVLG